MVIVLCIVSILFSYLMGSIPNSLIIGKLFYNKDVREYGSHNLGGTNTGRVLGKKAGIAVMILDQIKAVAAILLVYTLFRFTFPDAIKASIYLSMIGLVLGHCYPVFAGFKGGKAVAVTFGILFITNIWIYMITLAIYVILLKLTKYVSFGSIIVFFISGALCFIPFFQTAPLLFNLQFDFIYPILLLVIAVFIVIKHRANIDRLQKGTESKITWM